MTPLTTHVVLAAPLTTHVVLAASGGKYSDTNYYIHHTHVPFTASGVHTHMASGVHTHMASGVHTHMASGVHTHMASGVHTHMTSGVHTHMALTASGSDTTYNNYTQVA